MGDDKVDWARVKTILIIVFLIVNIFLILKLVEKGSNREFTGHEIESIKQLLGKNNIEMQVQVPSRFEFMQRIKVTEGLEGNALADKLLGAGKWSAKTDSDGEKKFISENKELKVNKDGQFEYKISNVKFNQKTLNESMVEEQVYKVLRTYIKIDDYRLDGISKNKNGYSLKFNYLYKGQEIFNNSITVEVVDTGSITITQGLIDLSGYTGKSEKVTPIDSLVELIKYTEGKTTVKSLTLGYYADVSKNGEIIKYGKTNADPAWKIETDKGLYIFDGINGTLLYKKIKQER